MKVEKINLEVGNHPSGMALTINGFRLDSGKPGKHVYIQGGIHGGEITYWIIEKLYQYLQKNLVAGKVTLMPIANPAAWFTRIYFNTPGKFDPYMGVDWNRTFPGKETGNLGQRFAYTLFQEALKADFVLDLHTSRSSFPFSMYSHKDYYKYAKLCGLEYNYFDGDENATSKGNVLTNYTNTIGNQLDLKGIDNITFECGSHDSFEPEYVEMCFQASLRLLKHFEVIKGDDIEAVKVKPLKYTQLNTYNAPIGGFVRTLKQIGDKVKKGDALFTVANPLSLGEATTVKANEDGVLQKISPTHIYWPGDEVMQLIPADALSEL